MLSFRDKPKLYSLALKPAARKSATPRALTGGGSKTGAGEVAAADAAATEFCTTVATTIRFNPNPKLLSLIDS